MVYNWSNGCDNVFAQLYEMFNNSRGSYCLEKYFQVCANFLIFRTGKSLYKGTLGGSNSLKNRHFCRSDTYKYDYYTSVGGTPVNFLFSQLRLLWLMKATSSQNWQEWGGDRLSRQVKLT